MIVILSIDDIISFIMDDQLKRYLNLWGR